MNGPSPVLSIENLSIGLPALADRQHADNTLAVDHAVAGCQSREVFKAVVDDEARAVFQGKISVRPQAQQTDPVGKGDQTITFTSTPPTQPVVAQTYTPTATGGASGLPVVLTIDGSASSDADGVETTRGVYQRIVVDVSTAGAYLDEDFGFEPSGGGVVVGGGERAKVQEARAVVLKGRQAGVFALADLIQGLLQMAHHMELVEGNRGLWQVVGDAFDEGRRHVDADRLDLLGWAAMLFEFVCQRLDGFGLTSLGDAEHPAPGDVWRHEATGPHPRRLPHCPQP